MGQLVLRVIAVVAAVLGAPVYVLGIGLVEMEIQRIRNQVVEDAVAAGSSEAQTSLPWVLTLLIVLLTAVVVAVFLPLPGRRRQADFRLPRYAFTAALTATVAIGVPTAVPTFWDELPAFLQPGPEALPNPALVWWYLATAGSRAPVALLGVMVTICLFDVYRHRAAAHEAPAPPAGEETTGPPPDSGAEESPVGLGEGDSDPARPALPARQQPVDLSLYRPPPREE